MSLWSNLLKESSKRVRLEDSCCIFVGDVGCGKSRLTEKLCFRENSKEQLLDTNGYQNKEVISYNYFDVEEGISNSELASKVNLWSISNKSFDNSMETVSFPSPIDTKEMFIIGLDLTNPQDHVIASLTKWLKKVILFVNSFEKIDHKKEKQEEKKRLLSEYIRNARKGKYHGNAEDDEQSNIGSNFSSPSKSKQQQNSVNKKQQQQQQNQQHQQQPAQANPASEFQWNLNLGIPILVVGCKVDLVQLNDIQSITAARQLQGQLRALCLQFGAALIYTSAATATTAGPQDSSGVGGVGGSSSVNNNSSSNNGLSDMIQCNKLRTYILHRLYPGQVDMELTLEDSIEKCFIPAGFDSASLISVSCGMGESQFPVFNSTTAGADGGSSLTPLTTENSDNADGTGNLSSDRNNDHNNADVEEETENVTELESEDIWLSGLQKYIKQLSDVTASAAGGAGSSSSSSSALHHSLSSSNMNLASFGSSSSGSSTPLPSGITGNNSPAAMLSLADNTSSHSSHSNHTTAPGTPSTSTSGASSIVAHGIATTNESKPLRRATTTNTLVTNLHGTAVAGTGGGGGTPTTGSDGKMAAPKPSRRTSVAAGTKKTGEKDVNSFFQDLLKK